MYSSVYLQMSSLKKGMVFTWPEIVIFGLLPRVRSPPHEPNVWPPSGFFEMALPFPPPMHTATQQLHPSIH